MREYIRPYQAKFFVATLLRIVADIAWLYPAYALASIITFLSEYHAGDSLASLWRIFFIWIAVAIFRTVGVYFAKRFCIEVAEHISIDAQLQGIRQLCVLDIAWHEKENTGNKLKRLMNGGNGINRILRIWINNLVEITVNFVGMIFILAKFDLWIGALAAIYLFTHLFFSYFFNKRAGEAAYRVNIQEEEVHGLMFEALNNIRTVKVMAMARALIARLEKSTEVLFKKLQTRIFWFQTSGSFLAGWSHVFRFLGFIFIIEGMVRGHYDVGFLILFNGYFVRIWDSVSELSEVSQDIVVSRYSIARMKEILREPVMIDHEQGKRKFSVRWKKIILSDVSFSYGNHKVLDHVSLLINRGEKVGIVGLSGAGKSTLFRLLLKEYENFEGKILFDDIPIQEFKKTNYFQYVAVVLQDTEVFNFSLKENILLANMVQSGNGGLFKKALSVAHVDDFITGLPQGVDTLIGEKGVKLSGGQKQRLGIARAIFKNPQLLLLDEATSHLDLESEEKIKDSLHHFLRDVTAVVIAHRLTTIREMDKIVVMEEGRVIETGSFDELYALKGRFFELWEKQKL